MEENAGAHRLEGLAQLVGARRPPPRNVVLVEGASDRRALEVLAERHGRSLDAGDVVVVAMSGATNVQPYLLEIRESWPDVSFSGLCDIGEVGYFIDALDRSGRAKVVDVAGLNRLGFFVCVPDLEAELIRAAGIGVVNSVIAERGDLESFDRFTRQPAWRGRPRLDQMRRFMGTRSGRKVLYAGLLAAAIPPERVPPPLQMLLDHLDWGRAGSSSI